MRRAAISLISITQLLGSSLSNVRRETIVNTFRIAVIIDEESEIVKIVNGTRYRFKGWYLNPDDPKASESPAAVQLTAESPAEITFYAVWGEYIDMPFTVHYETFGVEEIPSRTIMESALENGGQLEEVPAPPAGSGLLIWWSC